MKWPNPQKTEPEPTAWHHKFAWLPTRVREYTVWLEFYEQRLCSWRMPDNFTTQYWWEYRILVKKHSTSQPLEITWAGPATECTDF